MNEPGDRLLRFWLHYHQVRSSFLAHQSSESEGSPQELLNEAIEKLAEWGSLTEARNGIRKALKELEESAFKRALTELMREGHHDVFSSDSSGEFTEGIAAMASRIWAKMFKALSRPRIHTPPGCTLHRIADFCFSKATVESVLGPTLRDLQYEYQEALSERRVWKARWVRCRGYWSFWSAVVAQLPVSVVKRIYELWRAAG